MNAADLLASTVAGALVVISGGCHALFLTLARLRGSKILARVSVAAYLVLAFCSFVLANSLALSTVWYPVIAVMLAGYWLAPLAIWHLTQATHGPEAEP